MTRISPSLYPTAPKKRMPLTARLRAPALTVPWGAPSGQTNRTILRFRPVLYWAGEVLALIGIVLPPLTLLLIGDFLE